MFKIWYGSLNDIVCCSSANAAPEFEGRGGEDLATTLSAMMDRLYSSPYTLDRSCLCVVPGKHVKVLYVDIEVSCHVKGLGRSKDDWVSDMVTVLNGSMCEWL